MWRKNRQPDAHVYESFEAAPKEYQYGTVLSLLAECIAKPYQYGTVTHMTIADRLIEIAATHHGYITTEDAASVDVAPVELRKLAQRGRLTHEAHGLYRFAAYPHREHDDLMRAALWAKGRGVISHETALALWDLADVNPAKIDVTVPPPYRPRRRQGETYRVWVRALEPSEIEYVDDVPVVIPERAIVDAAQAGTARRFIEQAIQTARKRSLIGRQTEQRIRERIARAI
jgi:predicted transcriptional regulator of viral defense system